MAGPVLVTDTTSCARPPTEDSWLAETETVAVNGAEDSQATVMSKTANATAAFFIVPGHRGAYCGAVRSRGGPVTRPRLWAFQTAVKLQLTAVAALLLAAA